MTGDGASSNRKFFTMLAEQGSGVPYRALNPYSEEPRYVYFFSDVPHLLKTTRNGWSHSSPNSRTRNMTVGTQIVDRFGVIFAIKINGESISWKHLVDLYHLNQKSVQESGLYLLGKLRLEHVQLTNYSRMRVDLAAQVR